MLFVVGKPKMQRMIAIVRDDKKLRKADDIPFLRIEAKNDKLKISGRTVSAAIPADVYEEGVLFIETTSFRRLLKATYKDQKFITFQVNYEGLIFGDVRKSFGSDDMVLFPNLDEAPEKWPPPLPQLEPVIEPAEPEPTLFDLREGKNIKESLT